ncbi:MAG: hypothetical protein POELPBGB_03872 [Bacteroidia bacterium]|nr:hypothetical protein [Bacteroidia bacterium]
MLTLLKREILSFLNSLTGYIVVGVFLLITGLFMWVIPYESNVLDNGYATIDTLFTLAPWVFMFLVPAITMRSFADEKKSGTIELLQTKPLTDFQIIFAKYAAGVVLVLFSVAPTLVYYFSVYQLGFPAGNIDSGSVMGSYFGLIFLAAAFVAIGVFASSITDNQIISFIIALFLSWFFFDGFASISSLDIFGKVDNVLLNLGMLEHYISMSRGVLDTRDMIYFISLSAVFIVFTQIALQREKNSAPSLSERAGVRLLAVLIIIIAINIIGGFLFKRFDLTAEKRYSLSPTTIELINKLDDVVYVKVYLEGDFPADFKRLRNKTKEMLDEFRAYGKTKIEYEFINPSENPDKKQREKLYRQLVKQGLQPTTYKLNEKEGAVENTIFPGAVVYYREKEMPLQLLKSRLGAAPVEMLNNSIEDLEYEISNTIRKLSENKRDKVGFVMGHGELEKPFVADIAGALSEYYIVDTVAIHARLKSLDDFKAIIIAKPDTTFDEKDKFIIDQFIMRGGKVLWVIDGCEASMDSLQHASATLGMPVDVNLADQLFKYGVRINTNIIQDLRAAEIPAPTGYVGNQVQWGLQPWLFFPLIVPTSEHPVVRNLNAIRTEFASSIDTVGAKSVKKTILLASSKYSRTLPTPVKVGLEILVNKPDEALFSKSYEPVAVLLEGEFESVFTNRIPPQIKESKEINFKEKSITNKMIVISDGDVIKNKYKASTGEVFPLGYDPYTEQTYGNKKFILNCVNYLCDDSGLISVRARELKIRLLDKKKIAKQRLQWQLLNVALPIVLIIIFGIVQTILRKRRYAK